jgi:predicted acyl esterase
VRRIHGDRVRAFSFSAPQQLGSRLEISSSAAPSYSPNQNTGNPVATVTEWKVAHQTIYHDRTRASSITLPVMTRVPEK